MLKKILFISAVFISGIVGGIFGSQILWPYFIERPLFYKYRLEQAPINILKTEEIIVKENNALETAAERVQKSMVGIKSGSGSKIIEGRGVIVSSDGMILALNSLVPQGTDASIYIDGKEANYKIIKRDAKLNLALIKAEQNNLPPVGFKEFASLRYGERIFLAGIFLENGKWEHSVNEGIIKNYSEDLIATNIIENKRLAGSPIFDIEANMAGISTIDTNGNVSAISIKKIKEFVGF